MEDNKHFEQIMKSWLSNNTQARQSPSGMSDIKYELEKPRNCPSTSSATTYGYPYSPSDNSVSTADGYAPVNVFAQQQQQQGPNGLQYNLPPLDMNPCCSKYAKRQNQTNVTIDFSPGGTTTLQTQPDELKKILHQLQQPQQQQQQQPNLLSPHDQLLKMTQGLSITNGVSSNTYGNLVNGGDGVHINTNNNLDALTINHQTINTINNNMFINGGTSPAYSQQPAYSPGSMQSPSPVQFQQQQFQPDQQFQLHNPMMNMINHNQLSPNMNGGITPAYQQSNFLPVPMHSPSPGQQQYQEQLHYNQQQQQQPQQQQLQYQQVEPFEQSENPNISDLIETMDGVLVKDLIARNQNAGNWVELLAHQVIYFRIAMFM